MNATPRRALLVATGIVLLAPAFAADDPTPEATRAMLAKWVAAQQLIALERKDWHEAKEILRFRIEAVQGEIDALRGRLLDARNATAQAGSKRSRTETEGEMLHATGARLAGWAAELEAGLRSLAPRLPEPLLDKAKPLLERMPVDTNSTQVALAERFQNVAGILNEINEFNNDITLVTEVRTLSDGRPAEVRTVYVGLAQAYYVSAKGDAGVGRPLVSGWEWTSAAAIAPQVAAVVEVLRNKANPRFVPLPVKVQ